MGEEKRNQMMQNLFGDQSEDDDDEIDSDNDDYQRRPRYQSGEGEGEGEFEGGDDAEMEGQGEAEVESEGDHEGVEPDEGESEGERVGKEISDHRADSEEKEEAESEEEDSDPKAAATSIRRDKFVSSSEKSDGNGSAQVDDMADHHGRETAESDEHEEYGQRTVSSRRKGVVASDSEESDDNRYRDNEEEEETNRSRLRRSPGDEGGKHRSRNAHATDEIRDVFGDSDEDEQEDYTNQQEPYKSNMEDEENDGEDLRPEDMVQDEEMQYESDDNIEKKQKEKPMGPPLELEIPLRPPPGLPEKMNMIRVSNIMGIEPKPFDPKTYVEEDVFVTDDSGTRKRIRLKDNIVRWRNVRKPDGTLTKESNARFVRWSDGSLQLLIGNEVLDISVQEAQHDQTHLFLRHAKGLLQSQGRLLKKMRFMPSSLSSKSHRLLTALVDSRNKKVYKVKNCVTDIDPEREKEEKEKAEGQTIRANVLLHRKREKINRKYVQSTERGRQLSPRYLNALDEDDEQEDYYAPRGSRRRLDEDFEEAEAEKRIMNAKRPQVAKNVRPKPSAVPATRRRAEDSYESESEESEYESLGDADEEDRYASRKKSNERENKYDESDQEIYADEESDEEEVEEEPKAKSKQPKESLKRKEIESDSDSSPRKRTTQRRRAVVYDSDDE